METKQTASRPSALHRLVKGANFNWNLFLILVLVAEFVVFGLKNPKFLRIGLLLNATNDFLPLCII